MAPGTDLTAQSPPARIPKLKYRNPLPAEQVSLSSRISQDTAQPPLQRYLSTTSSDVSSSPQRPSFETSASTTSSSLASTPSSNLSSNDSKTSSKKKKKSNSVFGFLSLKEPSQVALEQFAEQQRKQSNGKGTTSPSNSSIKTSGTFASKKLPADVPRVNSKWDGIPDSVKKRQSTATTSTRTSKDTKRSSGTSFGSQGSQFSALPWNTSEFSVMSDESRGPPNSIISVPAGINGDIHHNGHYAPLSPSEGSLPEPSYYFPEEPMASGALPVEPSITSMQAEAGSQPKGSYPKTDLETIPDEFESSRSASPVSSINSVDTVVRDTAEAVFKKMNNRSPQQSLWGGDAPAVQSTGESESNVPESHDFLFQIPSSTLPQKNDSPMASSPVPYTAPAVRYTAPPAYYIPSTARDNPPPIPHYSASRPVHNFSRPMHSASPTSSANFVQPAPPISTPSSLRSRAMNSGLPTLYENSIVSTESLETIRDDGDAQSIAPSLTASSIAPSELSEHWHLSSRDRLGLGGQLRKSEVLPWKTAEDAQGKPKRHRLSLLVKGALRS